MANEIKIKNGKYLYLCDYNQLINGGIKDLYLEHAGATRKITIDDVEITEEMIGQKLATISQLIFEVTEGCNLRCKYCIYNDNYINQRHLTNLNMDFETARKGMDYIHDLIKDRANKTFSLSFYGGEPFLNFKLIQAIVAYGRECFKGWNLRFNLTTNLTLLTDTILDFLIENNIAILVSLDGDKVNHDAKRVFINGTGTFDAIMKNLEKIHAYNPEYFQTKVSFSAVYSLDLSILNLYHFFTDHPMLQQQTTRFSGVNTYNTTYYDTYPVDRTKAGQEYLEMNGLILDKVENKQKLSGVEAYLFNHFKDAGDWIATRVFTVLFGTCLFDGRLFLDVSGNFHICEKMNNRFSFGNVEQGFDYTRMKEIADDYIRVVKQHCLTCDIRFLCSRCFVNFCGDGRFELNPDFCRNKREVVERSLEKYVECKEKNLL